MLKSEAVRGTSSLLSRVPALFCATLDFQGYPDIRAMQNLRSRFLFPRLAEKLKSSSFDTYLPVNGYSGKMLQIQKNPKASLYCYDITTQEAALLCGQMQPVQDTAVKAFFWQPEWETSFPGGIYEDVYALVFFKTLHFKYYNGRGDTYENEAPRH